jgi:hypothetical protein
MSKVNMWLTLDEKDRPVIGIELIENSSAIQDKVLAAFIKRAITSGVKLAKKSGSSSIDSRGGCLSSSTYYIEWDE